MTHNLKNSLYVRVTKQFLDALRNGTTPWIKPWIEQSYSSIPVNAITERTYSGINVTILWTTANDRGFCSDRWLTFNQASNVGGRIRKGQKGTVAILFRDIRVKSKRGLTDQTSTEEDEPVVRKLRLIRSYTLFNVEQCENLPERIRDGSPTDSCTPEWDSHNEAEKFIRNTGATVYYKGENAIYAPKDDFIRMPPLSNFTSSAGYYSTIFHELIHWTGHKNRLNRPGIVGRNKISNEGYAFEELIAEIGSAFLCADLKIPGDLRHQGYVVSWIKILENNPRAIFHASAFAWQAFKFLQKES